MIYSARMPLRFNFGQKNEQNLFFGFRPFYYRALLCFGIHTRYILTPENIKQPTL